jgi:hypothetical protein
VIYMDKRIAKLALAGALTGLLGVGGVSIASAQEDGDDTTTTVVEEGSDTTTAPADAADREDCPDKPADDTAAADAAD